MVAPVPRLSLPFNPTSLDIEGSCRSWVYAYAVLASTDNSRESKDFCGGQSLWEGQGKHLGAAVLREGGARVRERTLLVLDLSDIAVNAD